ncbi:MAG: alcohol dehydrogenase catalytic domain-containing protein [Aestuariivirga sp.]
MRAMVFHRLGEKLHFENVPDPEPTENQILITVEACDVCRTDLHIVDGDLIQPKLPQIPGHEIVGRIVRIGSDVAGFSTGMRVAVPLLGYICGIGRQISLRSEEPCLSNFRRHGIAKDNGNDGAYLKCREWHEAEH